MSYTSEDQQNAEKLFRAPCVFVAGCTTLENLLPETYPEVAFVGRSNVGKSSLINSLVHHKNLARVSNTPGRTQEINFFNLNGQIYLVDLPGYGYAEAPKKKVRLWNELMKDYLRGRTSLRRVYVLIDARHGLKPVDYAMFKLLDESAVSYQVVLTKADKISVTSLAAISEKTLQAILKMPAAHPHLLVTSSIKGIGIKALQSEIYLLSFLG